MYKVHSSGFILLISLLGSLFGLNPSSYAGSTSYAVWSIDAELIRSAKAVVRISEEEFEINSIDKAERRVHYAVTILNNNGLDNAKFKEYYNKFRRITGIHANLYNAAGEKIKSFEKSEVQDLSAASGFSLYDDSRVKYLDPAYNQFPFTIEYFCNTEYSGLIDYPDWYVYPDYNVSVENSSLKVINSGITALRYLEKNLETPVVKTLEKQTRCYYWSVKNQKAIKEESIALPLSEFTPRVYLAPANFSIEGYSGNSETWKGLGAWAYSLIQGRDKLSPETQTLVKHLTENAADNYARIRILYEYMQNRTRYVSVQLGVGAWQPADAATVDKVAYGDCKALSNYLKALLQVIGIKSYYALVSAGTNESDIILEFPSQQFNHVILCVPVSKDTLWLECTSQQCPFAFTGSFTDDRHVLLVTEEGGVITRTPAYTAQQNAQIRRATVTLDENGSGLAAVNTLYKGIAYDLVAYLVREDEKTQKADMYNRVHLKSFEIINFKHSEHKDRLPYLEEGLNMKLKDYASISGDRMIFPLNLMTKWEVQYPVSPDRRSGLYLKHPFSEADTIIYKIPPDFVLYSKPESISLETAFGVYKTEVITTETEIRYIRSYSINKLSYPVSRFSEMADFLNKVNRADGNKVVLKRR
jgi:hypothetical protein